MADASGSRGQGAVVHDDDVILSKLQENKPLSKDEQVRVTAFGGKDLLIAGKTKVLSSGGRIAGPANYENQIIGLGGGTFALPDKN